MGFSYGAIAGLRIASRTFQQLWLGGERFQAVIAFYPWCGEFGPGPDRNLYPDTETPLLLILGEDDDETPAAMCLDAARRIAERGRPIAWKVYPGTTHSFDSSIMGNRPFTRPLPGGRTTTYRYNRESTEDAWRESREFLARHLKGRAPPR
jgi:dienelactone hydrolase